MRNDMRGKNVQAGAITQCGLLKNATGNGDSPFPHAPLYTITGAVARET